MRRNDNAHQEIELKFRIKNAGDFGKLQAMLKAQSTSKSFAVLRQTNYFFDTHEFALTKKFIALRLRDENGKFILCAKQGKGEAAPSSLTVRVELEVEISKQQAGHILNGKVSPELLLNKLEHPLLDQIAQLAKNEPLNLVGSFKNVRTVIPITIDGNPIALELDETTFNDQIIHYELEAELSSEHSPDIVEQFLQDQFRRIKIEILPSKSKSQRFFELLGQRMLSGSVC